ncbi:hypothetical protein IQ268_15860 [Oculatella sp. LEGE 06141]|uniref:hypothetical protein n=1 Tax=Oculatella sp. LEGE 06141 TaxID=1828648 RepID=UPI00188268FC|nr:hypothetical protein [Oculatella sp. LEGE 06141]MBE9180046.1 hypothetical protein [Oculatella sp. LEGE 06141]
MSGLLLHAMTGTGMQCTHLAPVAIVPDQKNVLVNAQPVATLKSKLTVAGCPFQIPPPAGPKLQPCVTVQWVMVSTRVFVNGQPVLLQPLPGKGTGSGICQSVEPIPQGAPIVKMMQTRVIGT